MRILFDNPLSHLHILRKDYNLYSEFLKATNLFPYPFMYLHIALLAIIEPSMLHLN